MLNRRLIARTRFRVVVSVASYSGDGVGYSRRHHGSRYLRNDGTPSSRKCCAAKRPIRDGENGSQTKSSVLSGTTIACGALGFALLMWTPKTGSGILVYVVLLTVLAITAMALFSRRVEITTPPTRSPERRQRASSCWPNCWACGRS
jgi:hypothetical protein